MARQYRKHDWAKVMDDVVLYKSRHPKATWHEIGRVIEIDGNTLRKKYKDMMMGLPITQQVANEIQVMGMTDENDPRIASLLAKAEINLDFWEIQKAVVNEWGTAQNYQAKVWLKYNDNAAFIRDVKPQMLQDVRDVAEEVANYPSDLFELLKAEEGEEDILCEVSAAEPHVGKLGWGDEVRDNYDSDIAVQRYKDSIITLLSRVTRAYTPSRFLYVFGSDFMHIDSKVSTTTAGTFQDTDTRWHKIFRTSHKLARWTVEMLRRFGKPVDVIVIPGNHDELSAFAVGEVLSAVYEGQEDVTVDNRATPRKYYRHGEVLLGYTHGSEENHKELPNIMADEAREHWAEVRFNIWHIGHRHNKKTLSFTSQDQFRTVEVYIVPSLCGQDYWHYKKGYRHIPQSTMFLWSATEGELARFTYAAPRVHKEAP